MKRFGLFSLLGKSQLTTFLGLLLTGHISFGAGTISELTQTALETALAGGGTVLFGQSGTIPLTRTITISQDTRLDANGFAVTVSGGNAVRLFQVNRDVRFELINLTLADGRYIGARGASGNPPAPGQDGGGAGILNQGGTLVLIGCTLTNHFVQGGDAGINTDWGGANNALGGHGLGAAICSLGGSLRLTNCLLMANVAKGGQGSTVSATLYDAGDAGGARGGAIYANGTMVALQAVTLATNSCTGAPAQIGISSQTRAGDAAGGALYITNSSLFLGSSVLASNSAAGGGAAPVWTSSGKGSGHAFGGSLFVAQDSSAVICLSGFSNNVAAGGRVNRYEPAGVGRGGALFAQSQCQISDCLFVSNHVAGAAGVYAGVGQGGGVYSANTLAITRSTFAYNQAQGGMGIHIGGGVAGEGGAVWSSGTLACTNSTWIGNRAAGGDSMAIQPSAGGPGRGGAVCVSGGNALLINATFAYNRGEGASSLWSFPAGASQGGSLYQTNGSVTVRNSILAYSATGGEVWGIISDGGFNLCSDGSASFSASGSLNNADPLLAALSHNGGATPTMGLLVGSPARDAISANFPPADQRGVLRPQGPAADMGAFEADYVGGAPVIVNQPMGKTVRAGSNVTFTVVASSVGALAYQWRKDGIALAQATAASLLLTNVQAADAGTYSVLVTNASGMTPSEEVMLAVDSMPLILGSPTSLTVAPGASATFSVQADGPALAYQWWHDTRALAGATSSTLTLASALAGTQGDYFAVVSNFAGTATSRVASLTFDAAALSILVAPKDQTVETGYPASFSVLVSGIPPFSYQWQHNGLIIPGATNSSLTLPAVSPNDNGSYQVVVSNGYRLVTSALAYLVTTPGATRPQLRWGRVGNHITLTFQAEANRAYRLLSSADLVGWSAVATNSALAAGPLQFVRPATNFPGLFYRVVTP